MTMGIYDVFENFQEFWTYMTSYMVIHPCMPPYPPKTSDLNVSGGDIIVPVKKLQELAKLEYFSDV